MRIAKIVEVCLPIIIPLFAGETKPPVDSKTYPHGTIICLKADEGPGVRFVLTRNKTCEGQQIYPRLEIDIRERPISVHKKILIGPDNGAFRCLSPNESCEQALSGEVMLEKFENPRARQLNKTEGDYNLKFRTGTETGHFEINCIESSCAE
jgi:hypothetical protein